MTHHGLAARFGDLSSRARPSVRNDRIVARALNSTWVFVLISGGNEHQTVGFHPAGDHWHGHHRFIDGASG
uniref:Uncharacterized protein n=1 Tax=Bionectria ochroleuca TaxID=29856 RepID=A0A0B7JV78_BIOOC